MADRYLFVAPTFRDSYQQLPERLAEETAEAWQRLSDDPLSPGLNWERLYNLGSARVDSVRVTRKYRLILASLEDRFVLLWVDNHDEAYDWAARHRSTIASLVERAERMRTAGVGTPASVPRVSDEDPIPLASPDLLVEMAGRGFAHYFTALDERQATLVTLDTSNWGGLAFVKGGAGTGKSSIAIRRAIHLAGEPALGAGRVLYLCYNRVLMETVRQAIDSLADPAVAEEIEVTSFHRWAARYSIGRGVRIDVDAFGKELRTAVSITRPTLSGEQRSEIDDLSDDDLANEILAVLRPNQFGEVGGYLDVTRPRSQGLRPLRRPQREVIWELNQRIRPEAGGPHQWDDLIERARVLLDEDTDPPRYRAVIVDEAQDCSPVMARLARALSQGRENTMMVFADAAQSIYAHGFTWAQRELQPPGSRVRFLRIPYRSTRQIHALAASLYDSDEEMYREVGEMRQSDRDGPVPVLAHVPTAKQELDFIADAIRTETDGGRRPSQIAVLTSRNRRAQQVAKHLLDRGIAADVVSRSAPDGSSVSVLTVHSAKGLDFSSVYLLDFEPRGDSTASERAQLYVALTRSSNALTIVCRPRTRSPLLDDLAPECYRTQGLLEATS